MKLKPSKRTKREENKENDESITKVYYIEKILRKRISKKGHNEYLIKWLDFSEKHNTWEPESNLNEVEIELYNEEKESKNQAASKLKRKLEDEDEEEESGKALEKKFKKMIEDGEKSDLVPVKIIGATDLLNDKLVFFFEFEDGQTKPLRSSVANVKFPQIVISFYEKNYVWKE